MGSLQGLRLNQKPQARGDPEPSRRLAPSGGPACSSTNSCRGLGFGERPGRGEAERKPSWKSGVWGLTLYHLPGVVSGCRSGGGLDTSVAQNVSPRLPVPQPTPSRLIHGNLAELVTITRGQHAGNLGDAGLTLGRALYLPHLPGVCLSPAGGSAAPRHPSITCTRVSSRLPEAGTHLDPSSTVPPAPSQEIFEDTHCPYAAPVTTLPQEAPLWTLTPWNIPGCLPGRHRCHVSSLLLGLSLQNATHEMGRQHQDHGCTRRRLRGPSEVLRILLSTVAAERSRRAEEGSLRFQSTFEG